MPSRRDPSTSSRVTVRLGSPARARATRSSRAGRRPVQRAYYRWYSESLRRDMELLIFGHRGARVLAFPPRCGRFHEYEDRGLIHAIEDKLDAGWLQLFCVDSVDHESLYADWAPRRTASTATSSMSSTSSPRCSPSRG